MNEQFKTVNEIEEYLKAALEQRKNDVIKSAGAVSSAKEFIVVHNQFLEKSRNELQKMTNDGKITVEIANFVLAWLGKSHTVAIEYSTSSKSRHDIKSGETLAIDATSRLIKNVKERELKKLEEDINQQTTNLDVQEKIILNENIENKKVESIKQSKKTDSIEKSIKKTKNKKQKTEKDETSLRSSESKFEDSIKEKKNRPDEKGKLSETVKRLKSARKQEQQKV